MQYLANGRLSPGPRSAVVFDCDGLLITTERAWDLAYGELFAQYGIVVGQDDRNRLRGLDLEAVGHVLARLLQHAAPAHVLAGQALDLMRGHIDDVIAPMPGAVELVSEMAGTRPLAVASNAPSDVVRAYLRRFFDLADLVIVGSDMVSAPKPHPDVYLAACEALGSTPAATWALEDSAAGAAAATAAGLFLVGVPTPPAAAFPCDLQIDSLVDPRLRRALYGTDRTAQ